MGKNEQLEAAVRERTTLLRQSMQEWIDYHSDRGDSAHQVIHDAAAWFDEHRPQWGPGTLPTWYTDAVAWLRKDLGDCLPDRNEG